jgi:hypothetical protein
MTLSREQSQSLHSSIVAQTETVIAGLMQLYLPDLELDGSKAIRQICTHRKSLKSTQDV